MYLINKKKKKSATVTNLNVYLNCLLFIKQARNTETMSAQRHDVESTLIRHCLNAACKMGTLF